VSPADRAALVQWLEWNRVIGAGQAPCTWPVCPVHGWESR
jgi:hypothetical protein